MMTGEIKIDTIHLFPVLDKLLLELLRSLTEEEWVTQTIAKRWKVKGVALTRFNDFSFLTLLAGGLLFITWFLYKLKPQTKMHRFGAMQLKTARRSEETWKVAIQFAATPITVAGLLLVVMGLLPIFVAGFRRLTFSFATTLILTTSLVLITMTKRHIIRHFDEEGKRKSHAQQVTVSNNKA